MEVNERWFNLLVSGRKPVEGRKKSLRWEKLIPGQLIELTCKETREIRTFRITHINEYENLEQYLCREGIHRCLPGVTSFEEAVQIYQEWSTPEELKQYRFLAIGLECQH